MKSHFSQARVIWSDATGVGRGRVALFRRAFSLEAPSHALLHLFADTRYRLFVNGKVVGHGPARFHLASPEFDSWDITSHLQSGDNVIAVMVQSMGRETFSNDNSIGGLIASCEIKGAKGEEISFSTDSSWKVCETAAYYKDTIALNFALGPFEYLDGRELSPDWVLPSFSDHDWDNATVLTHQNHWGELRPRSIALLDESELTPQLVGTFLAHGTEVEPQFASVRYCTQSEGPLVRKQVVLATSIYSPKDQTVTLGVSWGRFWLNGTEVKPQPRPDLYWRGDCTVVLKAGWNSWSVCDSMTGDAFEFALQWPKAAALQVDAGQESETQPRFLATSASRDVEAFLEAVDQGKTVETAGWSLFEGQREMPSPYSARVWEHLRPLAEGEDNNGASAQVYLFDFGLSVLGRPQIEFTASAGTTLDLLYSERLTEGVADHTIQALRMGERYVAREGRQSWQTFHPRGMRYLELVVRGDDKNFVLHSANLTRATLPVSKVGQFECSDPLLNRIWEVGRDTLLSCMEDGYIDCPWRERGIYTGDVLVQFYSNLATFGDHSLMRRSLEQLFETQGESGELAPSGHGLPAGRHPDYSAIALQGLWHYWARTGDIDFLKAMKPRVEKLLVGLQSIEDPGLNLVDVSGREPYVDVSYLDTQGINCASNCFHQQAFVHGARVLRQLDDEAQARRWEEHAEEVAAAIRDSFWSREGGFFLDRRLSDVPQTEPSGLGNTLPLLYGIAAPEQVQGALDFVTAMASQNNRVPRPQKSREFNFSPYSSFYLLGVLYEHSRDALAETFIRENWGAMLEQGATTWWEYFIDNASLCHAWSSCPTYYLSSQVLGVRYATSGEPDEVIIEPRPGNLEWAKGVYPHPRGPIRVQWQKTAGTIQLDYDVPESVRVVTAQHKERSDS